MDRINEQSLYSSKSSVYQTGGFKSSKSPKSPKNNKSSYRPGDVDGETSSALDKFRKANRELKRDLDKALQQLNEEKLKNSKLEKQIKSYKLNLI